MHYVSVEGLTKSYGINPLFSNISFHINEGDKIALIARNGIGKSTLLRILTGKETPDSGKSWVHKDVTVALFEQDPQFEEGKSVLENIFELNQSRTRNLINSCGPTVRTLFGTRSLP